MRQMLTVLMAWTITAVLAAPSGDALCHTSADPMAIPAADVVPPGPDPRQFVSEGQRLSYSLQARSWIRGYVQTLDDPDGRAERARMVLRTESNAIAADLMAAAFRDAADELIEEPTQDPSEWSGRARLLLEYMSEAIRIEQDRIRGLAFDRTLDWAGVYRFRPGPTKEFDEFLQRYVDAEPNPKAGSAASGLRAEAAREIAGRWLAARRERTTELQCLVEAYDDVARDLGAGPFMTDVDRARAADAEAGWRGRRFEWDAPWAERIAQRYVELAEAEAIEGVAPALALAAGLESELLDEARHSGVLLISVALHALRDDERIKEHDELRYAVSRLLLSGWSRLAREFEEMPRPESDLRHFADIQIAGVWSGRPPFAVRDEQLRAEYEPLCWEVRRNIDRAGRLLIAEGLLTGYTNAVRGGLNEAHRQRTDVDTARLADLLVSSGFMGQEAADRFVERYRPREERDE